MAWYLGIDTSNYTTSAALYNPETDELRQTKRLLPVKEGTLGLRQSDAVFHHVRQLPELLEELLSPPVPLRGVGASTRPRETQGSYMPCFLVGSGAARELAAAAGIPLCGFSHQQGHVAAALYGAGRTEWRRLPFLAFHVSGGTTEALLVTPDDREGFVSETVARSLDLKAGQLIDRVGGLLGLPFPAGPALDVLAGQAVGDAAPRASLAGADCHLSGVENQCRAMVEAKAPPAEVARFCLLSVCAALAGMTQALIRKYGPLPLVYAGGVMSNTLLRERLGGQFHGVFAPPALSADNAAGIALLTAWRDGAEKGPE